jgi:hypothetical protein
MKLTHLFISIATLTGLGMAAPTTDPLANTDSMSNSENLPRQWTQPDKCHYCDNFFHQCQNVSKPSTLWLFSLRLSGRAVADNVNADEAR